MAAISPYDSSRSRYKSYLNLAVYKSARDRCALSDNDIARRAGVKTQTLRSWAEGHPLRNLDAVLRLAATLGVAAASVLEVHSEG